MSQFSNRSCAFFCDHSSCPFQFSSSPREGPTDLGVCTCRWSRILLCLDHAERGSFIIWQRKHCLPTRCHTNSINILALHALHVKNVCTTCFTQFTQPLTATVCLKTGWHSLRESKDHKMHQVARTSLGAKGIATRSKDATRGSWHHC